MSTDVDKAGSIIFSNASRISPVVGTILRELTGAMKQLHENGTGTEADILDILKRFFAHQILLQMKNELPSTTVSEELTACAADNVILEPLASTLDDISKKLAEQLKTVFDIRNIIIDLYFLAGDLELESIPFTECIRAYAELHYCQICVPLSGYAESQPCNNVCRNVMIGCSGFLHQFREALKAMASKALAKLEVVQMNANGYRQTIERLRLELQNLATSVQGQGSNIIAQVCARACSIALVTTWTCHRSSVTGN